MEDDNKMTSIQQWRSRPVGVIALLTLFSGLATAQQTQTVGAQPTIDISGLWLVQDPGSGTWTDFFENSTGPAPVLPDIRQYNDASRARQRSGDIVNRTAASAGASARSRSNASCLTPSPSRRWQRQ